MMDYVHCYNIIIVIAQNESSCFKQVIAIWNYVPSLFFLPLTLDWYKQVILSAFSLSST